MLLFCLACTVVMMTLVEPAVGEGSDTGRLTVWTLFAVTVAMALAALKKIVGRLFVAVSETEIRSVDGNVFGADGAAEGATEGAYEAPSEQRNPLPVPAAVSGAAVSVAASVSTSPAASSLILDLADSRDYGEGGGGGGEGSAAGGGSGGGGAHGVSFTEDV